MEHIYGLTDFLDQPRKWSQEANNFDVFYVQYIETGGSALKKKCCLIRNLNYSLEWNAVRKVCSHKKKNILEWCKFSHQADQQQLLGGGKEGEGGGTLGFWAGVSNVTQEPLAFTTPCSAAILLP